MPLDLIYQRTIPNVPDWVKVMSFREFKQQLDIHCSTEDEKKHFKELRRRVRNRVRNTFHLVWFVKKHKVFCL